MVEALLRAWKSCFRDKTLAFFEPRHVGVAKERDPIRLHGRCKLNGATQIFRALVRKTIHQIHADVLNAGRAQCADCLADKFHGLNATDCALDVDIELLHAQRSAIDTCFSVPFRLPIIEIPRIDFDGVVNAVRRVERDREPFRDLAKGVRRENVGRAAAPVNLGNAPRVRGFGYERYFIA